MAGERSRNSIFKVWMEIMFVTVDSLIITLITQSLDISLLHVTNDMNIMTDVAKNVSASDFFRSEIRNLVEF